MKMKLLLTILTLCFSLFYGHDLVAGPGLGAIKGRVVDAKTGEPLAFAKVFCIKDGVIIQSTQSDQDGVYTFQLLKPGALEVEAIASEYKKQSIKGVMVIPDRFAFINIRMDKSAQLADTTTTGSIVPFNDRPVNRCVCPLQSEKLIISGLPASFEGYYDTYKNPENTAFLFRAK